MRNLFSDTSRKPTAIRSVYRAVNILICLANDVNTVTDIARHCKLTKPTVYRLLKTLEEMMLVTQDHITRRYYMGPLINHISSNPYANHHYLINCAMEELRHLWNFTGETVELNIMIGLQYIRLFEIQSKYDLKVVQGPDPVGPVYVGATAKVLLSQLNDEDLKMAMRNIIISRVTEHSVTDKNELREQIAYIQKQGYGISYGERIAGVLCISAPVDNYFWPVALSLVGPEGRIKPREEEMLKEVKNCAMNISRSIKEYFELKGVMDNEEMISKRLAEIKEV
jgi:DNA-binding IclR family transcriptional regulator